MEARSPSLVAELLEPDTPRRLARGEGPRQRILERVHDEPGVSITELAERTRLGHTTVCHHLGVLARRGLLVRERWGGSVRVFPASFGATHRALVALAHCGKTAEVLRAIATDAKATPASLARDLDLHRQAVQWHLARLERAGVLRIDKEHRPYRLELIVRADTVLRAMPEFPPPAMVGSLETAPPTLAFVSSASPG